VVRAAGLPHRQQARPGDEPQALVRLDAQRNLLSGRPGPPSGRVVLVMPAPLFPAELAGKRRRDEAADGDVKLVPPRPG
jgi:hypothetical protein